MIVAAFVLLSWPFIAMAFFGLLGPARGLIWSVTVGYLFLPEAYGFDVPALPPYNKYAAIAFSAALGVLMTRSRSKDDLTLVSADPVFKTIQIALFILLVIITPVMTWVTNPESLINGSAVRPGLSYRDAIRLSADMVIYFLPLFLAWRVLTRPEHHRELLIAIVAFSFAYSFLVLFEWRMSPQLNIWIYGYFQHDWGQHNRGGGFRPIVFLQHGLVVGFFLMTATLAAFALSREKEMPRGIFVLLGCWTLLVLFMSRNFGATFLALVFTPLFLFVGPKSQVRIVTVIAVLFLLYPVLKQLEFTPEKQLLSFFEGFSQERAASLGVRIRNEEELLVRALEKPFFGWGGWARAHIFNERGRDMTLIDGIWIVILGQRGWIGYIAFFGIVLTPLLFLVRAARRKTLTPVIAGMSLIMGVNLVDMIPNSTLSPLGLLMLGSIAAFVQFDIKGEQKERQNTEPVRGIPRYTRFVPNDSLRDETLTSYRRSQEQS